MPSSIYKSNRELTDVIRRATAERSRATSVAIGEAMATRPELLEVRLNSALGRLEATETLLAAEHAQTVAARAALHEAELSLRLQRERADALEQRLRDVEHELNSERSDNAVLSAACEISRDNRRALQAELDTLSASLSTPISVPAQVLGGDRPGPQVILSIPEYAHGANGA
jgi:chromosome segregation ATPase